MNRATDISEQGDRRERSRLTCRAPVRIYMDPDSPSDSFFMESTNLSSEGVFLHSDLLFPEGDWLDLEFMVPGRARPVRGRGQVVRVHASYEAPGPGMAVHIPRMKAEDREYLRQMNMIIRAQQ